MVHILIALALVAAYVGWSLYLRSRDRRATAEVETPSTGEPPPQPGLMKPDHFQMRAALQAELVPLLRQRGFSGSFPHFRRITDTAIALLTVQFNKYGGSFAIEVGRAPASDYAPWPGKLIPPTNLSAHDLPLAQRARLVAEPGKGDEWFSYRHPLSPGEDSGRFTEPARSAAALLDELDAWWGGAFQPHIQDFAKPS